MMDLPKDIYKGIFYFITKSEDYSSVLLVCKTWIVPKERPLARSAKWNNFGYLYLDFSIDDNYPLKWATKYGSMSLLNKLLTLSGIDPSYDDQYAFRRAAACGHLQIVAMLLEDPRGRAEPCGPKAVDPSANDQYAIRHACHNGHYDVVERLLLCDKIDPSAMLQLSLRSAASEGHLKIVALLLKDPRGRAEPCGPKAVDCSDAIQNACQHGHYEVVALLLKDPRGRALPCGPKAVDPSAEDQWVIRWACSKGYLDIVNLLLQDPRGRAPPDGPEGR
jgi:ankyrin repeat protein